MAKRVLWVVSDELMERLFCGCYQVEGPVSVEEVVRDETAAITGYSIEVDDEEFDQLEMTATDDFAEFAIGGMVQ